MTTERGPPLCGTPPALVWSQNAPLLPGVVPDAPQREAVRRRSETYCSGIDPGSTPLRCFGRDDLGGIGVASALPTDRKRHEREAMRSGTTATEFATWRRRRYSRGWVAEKLRVQPSDLHNVFGRERIDDRQISEVIGIAHGIIADGTINQAEVEYLAKWLAGRMHVTRNPVVRLLHERLGGILADGVLDVDEAKDLMTTLVSFAGGEFESGELTKSTSLPLCEPAPAPMTFPGSPMCFTGTFAFGAGKACETAAISVGAIPGSLTAKTRYLVIGVYATESWSQSAFGRKIEKAVEFRATGRPINIIGEMHWVEQMTLARHQGV